MIRFPLVVGLVLACASVALAMNPQVVAESTVAVPEKISPAPNGVVFPAGFQDWDLVGISHRSDNNTLRVILGNAVAIDHARSGATRQWPDGSVLVKVVWKQKPHAEWDFAATPDKLVHVEVMEKDRERFPYTGGWGFGRWTGPSRKPHGRDADFAKQCFACHEPVAQTDYVFTRPVFTD